MEITYDKEYVVVSSDDGEDIYLTEEDIDNMIDGLEW